MARRRTFTRFGSRNRFGGTPAPTPVTITAPVIDIPKLQQAYEWMTLEKMLGFKLVLEWYAANQVALLYNAPLDATQQKTLHRAQMSQNQGDGTPYEHEKIAGWSMAIHLYEKLWSSRAPNFPLLDNAAHAVLSPHVANIQKVLGFLNTCYNPAGMKFRVTFGADREFTAGEILIPQADLEAMIPQAPMAVVLAEVPTVCSVLAIVTAADGTQSLDGNLYKGALPTVLSHVAAWAGVTRDSNKPTGKAPKRPKVKGAKQQGGTGAATPGVRIKGYNVIHIVPGAVNRMAGKRLAVFNLVRDGMTVSMLQTEAEAKVGPGFRSRSLAVLKVMVQQGTVTLS